MLSPRCSAVVLVLPAGPLLLLGVFVIPPHNFRSGLTELSNIYPAADACFPAGNGLDLRSVSVTPIVVHRGHGRRRRAGISR